MRSDASVSVPRIALLVLVALLVALAGCSSGGNGAGTATTGEMPPATTDAGATPTGDGTGATPAEDGTGGASTTAAEDATTTGTGSTTTDDGRGVDIASGHVDALNRAGSFTVLVRVETSAILDGRRVNTTVVRTVAVDLEARRGLVTERVDNGTGDPLRIARYTEGNVTYRRTGTRGSEPRYARDSAPYDGQLQPVNTALDRVNAFVGAPIDWQRDGVGILDGTAVPTYNASGPGAFGLDPERFTDRRLQRVTAINATALVDGDGVVRRMRLTLSGIDAGGDVYRQSRQLAIADLGATTVSEPVWLPEARNSTAGGS